MLKKTLMIAFSLFGSCISIAFAVDTPPIKPMPSEITKYIDTSEILSEIKCVCSPDPDITGYECLKLPGFEDNWWKHEEFSGYSEKIAKTLSKLRNLSLQRFHV